MKHKAKIKIELSMYGISRQLEADADAYTCDYRNLVSDWLEAAGDEMVAETQPARDEVAERAELARLKSKYEAAAP